MFYSVFGHFLLQVGFSAQVVQRGAKELGLGSGAGFTWLFMLEPLRESRPTTQPATLHPPTRLTPHPEPPSPHHPPTHSPTHPTAQPSFTIPLTRQLTPTHPAATPAKDAPPRL